MGTALSQPPGFQLHLQVYCPPWDVLKRRWLSRTAVRIRGSMAGPPGSPYSTLMVPVVSITTALSWARSITLASRILAHRSSSVTRALLIFSAIMVEPTISRIGSLSTTFCIFLELRRSTATRNCNKNKEARATSDWGRGGSLLTAVEAMREPMATVMAKSKLDMVAKLRSPAIRVSITTLKYIPGVDRITISRAPKDVPNQVKTILLLLFTLFSLRF